MTCWDEIGAVPSTDEDQNWAWVYSPLSRGGPVPYSGKWLLNWTCEEAPERWSHLVAETVDRSFWCAKARLEHPASDLRHLVCVYTPDYRDVEDVRAIGIKLWQLRIASKDATLWYKPDSFTRDRIYSGRSGGASIYRLRSGQTYLATTPGFQRLGADARQAINRALSSLAVLRGGHAAQERGVIDELCRVRAQRALASALGEEVELTDPDLELFLHIFRHRLSAMSDQDLSDEARDYVGYGTAQSPSRLAAKQLDEVAMGTPYEVGALATVGGGCKAHTTAHRGVWGTRVSVLCGIEGTVAPAPANTPPCKNCVAAAERERPLAE